MTHEWTQDEAILTYDPFAGDDYGGGFVDRGKKLVVGRQPYECHICFGPIAKGERQRVDSCIMDGEWLTARFCWLCCEAMELDVKDGGSRVDDRIPDRSPSSPVSGRPVIG